VPSVIAVLAASLISSSRGRFHGRVFSRRCLRMFVLSRSSVLCLWLCCVIPVRMLFAAWALAMILLLCRLELWCRWSLTVSPCARSEKC
jgi:hypothetical protein